MKRAVLACVVLASSLALADERYAYDVAKPGAWALSVHVEATQRGGTMHLADRVTIHGRAGTTTTITTAPDAMAKGTAFSPLVTRQVSLDADHVLLLGWSSTGAGMQTYHALTIDARTATVVRTIVWTGDRGAAAHGVAISGTRVGFPSSTSTDGSVRAGSVTYDADALARLARSTAPRDATIYGEPFAPTASDEPRVWFDAR